jgi:hypothetical protein
MVFVVDLRERSDTIRGMQMVDHYCFLLSMGIAITLMALMAERPRRTRVEPPRPMSRENSAYAQIMKMAEQFAKNDPADWWKRGESPPDCNLPDPNPIEPF